MWYGSRENLLKPHYLTQLVFHHDHHDRKRAKERSVRKITGESGGRSGGSGGGDMVGFGQPKICFKSFGQLPPRAFRYSTSYTYVLAHTRSHKNNWTFFSTHLWATKGKRERKRKFIRSRVEPARIKRKCLINRKKNVCARTLVAVQGPASSGDRTTDIHTTPDLGHTYMLTFIRFSQLSIFVVYFLVYERWETRERTLWWNITWYVFSPVLNYWNNHAAFLQLSADNNNGAQFPVNVRLSIFMAQHSYESFIMVSTPGPPYLVQHLAFALDLWSTPDLQTNERTNERRKKKHNLLTQETLSPF